MIPVSAQTKNAYKISSHRNVAIFIGEDVYTNSSIYKDSLEIEEILEANEYLQFMGCNASKASFTLFGINTNYKGQSVTIRLQADSTDAIAIFQGYVESQSDEDYVTGKCKFVCYDALYRFSQIDVASWYDNLTYPISIHDFRESLFTALNFACKTATLVNDNITIEKQYMPANLSALDVIKAICQMNAVYGIINRSGEFEFRTLQIISTADEAVEYYQTISYEHYSSQPINKVIVRQRDTDEGCSCGTGNNIYIMQGNLLTYGLEKEDLQTVANNIYPLVSGRSYVPYEAETYGMPYLEVGDVLSFDVYDTSSGTTTTMMFYVLSRYMSGIQNITDNVKADGQEYQTVFLSALDVDLDTVKADVEELKEAVENAVIKSYQATNRVDFNIGSEWAKILDFTPFNQYTVAPTDLVFEGSITLEIATTETSTSTEYTINPCNIEVKYRLNRTENLYIPKEVYDDGTHTLTLNHQFVGVNKNHQADLEVFIRATSGSAVVSEKNAIGYLWGQNLADRRVESMAVYTMPLKTNYMQGDALDLSGLLIEGTYNDGSVDYVQHLCTYDPPNGTILADIGTVTVEANLDNGEEVITVSFEITVEEMTFLRYVEYEETLYTYIIKGIKTNTIEEDEIHTLSIPNEFNGKTVVIQSEE